MRRFSAFLIVIGLWFSAPAMAEMLLTGSEEDLKLPGVVYDPAYVTPDAFLGINMGDAPVRHDQLVSYITQIANQSDRMKLEVIGYTHERRPILFVTVSSPENLARLDEIQAAQIARTEQQAVPADMPVVTWLNYGVHGVEESGMDAALPTIYHLAAATGDEIEQQLDQSVILITAIFNPDGHSRRAAWRDQGWSYNRNRDNQDRVKNFDFPGPRTNHYWFDLNRQWLLLTQPESRAWMRKWHDWRPNLSVDYHEMGHETTYYFHPGDPTRYFPEIPQEARDLSVEYARYSSNWLDTQGLLFYNEEGYDNFYIGKGSTFPLVNGGVGILFEAAQGMGGEVESDNGLFNSYRSNIRKHFNTSIRSIEAAVGMRDSLQRYQEWFYDSTTERAGRDETKAYVFAAPEDNTRVQKFIDLLTFHRIKVNQLARDVTIDGQIFRAGEAYIINLNQPQYRFAKALFDRPIEFENETFYDVSTWTMPLSFNVVDAALTGRTFRSNLVGAEVAGPSTPAVQSPDKSSYGYIFSWVDYYAPKALNQLLEAGLDARVMTKPFSVETTQGTQQFDRGAVMVHFNNMRHDVDAVYDIIQKVSADTNIQFAAVTSGWTPSGPQLGSPTTMHLEAPKPLIIVGDSVSSYDAGEMWHLLDYRMGVPISMMDSRYLGYADLDRYTHILLPGGSYSNLEEAVVETLKTWINKGGTLVAIRSAAPWAQDTFAPVEASDENKDAPATFARANYATKDDAEAQQVIGGAIFGMDLDITHPMGFGYVRRNVAIHRSGTHTLDRPKNQWAVIAEYLQGEPRLSGFAAADKRAAIAGTPAIIAERKGSGSVVLFADNPNFRAIWYGTNKLFMNALFFSTAFEPPFNFEDENEVAALSEE